MFTYGSSLSFYFMTKLFSFSVPYLFVLSSVRPLIIFIYSYISVLHLFMSNEIFKTTNKVTSFVSIYHFIKYSCLHDDVSVSTISGSIMVTSMSMAVLESTVPLWVMDTMDASQWQLGTHTV